MSEVSTLASTSTTDPQTPIHQIRSTNAGTYLSLSDKSPADIKRKLEQRLADTKAKMYSVGKLGESLVKQEMELNERIKEMELHSQNNDDEIRPELRVKLTDLENGFKEIEKESAKAFSKTIPFLGKENLGMPRTPGMDSPTKSEFVGNGTVSPSKNQGSSRRARNATPRQHDIEFAADIGQGLLEEVRKLQALLAQRDQKLAEAATSIARSDRQLESMDRKVKQLYEDQESLKDENWNMHVRGEELQQQLNSSMTDAAKFTVENARLLAQNSSLTSALESLKAKNAELTATVAETKAKHESEMSSLRRAQAGLQRDRSDLQRHVDELKQELSKRPDPQLHGQEEHDLEDIEEQEESITPVTQSPTASPLPSPIKNTPSRNAPLELETAKSSLHHAHRMVANLRNNLHREKTEKLELKRLLASAQDEVEQLRSKASGSKRAAKRPQLRRPNSGMLGDNRKAQLEINAQDPELLDSAWGDDEGTTSGAYVTAEEEYESDEPFMTATEHEFEETDEDAYRTGIESQPDSEDDGELTETESGASARKMPSLGKIRAISPSIAFSDEEDSPVRLPVGLKHRRSALRGERRIPSAALDPPPQPLFQELLDGAGSSNLNSPVSAIDSPASIHTAVPFSPYLATHTVETKDAECQCDPLPEPEPVVVPVIVYRDRPAPPSKEADIQTDPIPDPEPLIIETPPPPPVIIYKDRELPPRLDVGSQCDPIPSPPPPEPIIVQAEPIIIQAEPIIQYIEREKPITIEMGTETDSELLPIRTVTVTQYLEVQRPAQAQQEIQTDPLPPPVPVVVYREPEKPVVIESYMQTDPIPEPLPIIIPAEPQVIYREKERPESKEIGIQSDNLEKDVEALDVPPVIAAPIIEYRNSEVQTVLSIPTMETFKFDSQSVGSSATRPKTPLTIIPPPPLPQSPSIASEVPTSATATPKTVRSVSVPVDLDATPKSPLKEITNTRGNLGSPSRASVRDYTASPVSFSSRYGTATRRYGTVQPPALYPSPRATMSRSRMHSGSPTKAESRQPLSPTRSRMNMTTASRATTSMSHRTSISSFESEVDNRFGLNHGQSEAMPQGQYATSTDPNVIQAITTTMIGDFLYKYVNNPVNRSKITDKRHRRFFWIHPYTKTLYWSNNNPALSQDSNKNTRSAPIKRIAVIGDDNPSGGAYKKSIMCFTQNRTIKLTALTKSSHETWLRALNHILDRGPATSEPNDDEALRAPSAADTVQHSVDMREFGAMGMSRGSSHMASMSTMSVEGDDTVKHRSSFGRMSNMLKRDRGTMSTVRGGQVQASIYEASTMEEDSDYEGDHIHDVDEDGLENVRACCGGKHDVGTLTKRGKHTHTHT